MSAMYIERPTYKREKSAPETRPLLERLHWVHVILLSTTPLIALYGILTTTLTVKTMLWATLYYAFAGLGITAGYHRMWAHTAYSAT
ncbi:stearoyl-CoA 9-desaturase, partial [Coemansia sp. RSA 2673]